VQVLPTDRRRRADRACGCARSDFARRVRAAIPCAWRKSALGIRLPISPPGPPFNELLQLLAPGSACQPATRRGSPLAV